MNGYSHNMILANVSPAQIWVLIDILCDTTWRSRSFVEERYRERACNFSETFDFLNKLGWLRVQGTEIHPVNGWMGRLGVQHGGTAAVALLETLLDSPGEHQRIFAGYLSRFQSADGVVSCPARGELASADVSARNFLMELGGVRHEPAKKQYLLDPSFFGAFVWAQTQKGPGSQAELFDSMERRHQVGRRAELAVLAYERKRLGAIWADRVQDVAGEHPAAPYDIKSVTVSEKSTAPRYIEVKAVSPLQPEFHWSKAEIEAARLLRLNFYLYLIPAQGGGNFDLTRLQIIADPFAQVYSDTSTWDKLPTHFLCRPASPSIL